MKFKPDKTVITKQVSVKHDEDREGPFLSSHIHYIYASQREEEERIQNSRKKKRRVEIWEKVKVCVRGGGAERR